MRFANSRDDLATPVVHSDVEVVPEADEIEASVKGISIDVPSMNEQQQGLTGSNRDSITDNKEYIPSKVKSSATILQHGWG